ncbi:MAG: PBPRA1643 family SWIM/SEC-C metal-binding motif protein [bacterium]
MAKLGSNERPAVVRVRTSEKADEIVEACNRNGWKVIIGLEPGKPEDLSDFTKLINPPQPVRAEPTAGRNDPCPCGSGKKFKKCCGK